MGSCKQGCHVILVAVASAVGLSGLASERAFAGTGMAAVGLDRAIFAEPPPSMRPTFRWWWPGVAVEDGELVAEVEEMTAAGFGGAEINVLPYGLPPTGNPPETYMWGTDHWQQRMETAMTAAAGAGATIDLTVGPSWPWISPAVSGANSALSQQQLSFGHAMIAGPSTYHAAPPPASNIKPGDGHLVAVTAAQPGSGSSAHDSADTGPVLDPSTVVDLTGMVDSQGVLHWEAPPGDWILFGFWQGPTGQQQSLSAGRPGFLVVDHLRRESAEAALAYLDQQLFDRLGEDARPAAREIIEESLELDATLLWTWDFLEEFRSRRGYDLTPYLPVIFVPGQHSFFTYAATAPPNLNPDFDFPRDLGERVRRDYYQTLTDLWIDEHLSVLTEWAHSHGMQSRAQVFGTTLDPIATATAVDIPDTELLYNGTADFLRTLTSGAHLSGARKAAVELGSWADEDYMITLARLKREADRAFAAGVNQVVVHAYPYKYAAGAKWPSWYPFSSDWVPFSSDWVAYSYAEGWTSAFPLWQHLPALADYLARAQTVLQAGHPVTDIAIYRDTYGYPGGAGHQTVGEPELNTLLSRSGYSFDFINPATLSEAATRVKGGHLVVQPPGYKALVVDLDSSTELGLVDNSRAMAASVARRLVRFARRGLPIVFIGDFPTRGVSFEQAEQEDAVVRAAVARLRRSPNVRVVADESAVRRALSRLGVGPDLSLGSPQDVLGVHRRSEGGDYWFLWNSTGAPIRFTGSFRAARGAPVAWDLWSGDRDRVGLYRVAGKRVNVPLELGPLESVVLGFGGRARKHVRSTSAEEVVVRGGALLLRSTKGGRAHARLKNRRRRVVNFGSLPDPVVPQEWHLQVEGAVPEGEEIHDLALTELRDWRDIPELSHTSGTGTYRTTVTLGRQWLRDPRGGAYLELGRVEGGVQVTVNGHLVSPASVALPRYDLGPYLQAGSNTIGVELTTTLRNRLAALAWETPGYYRFQLRPETQPYGLMGPVRLVAYAERRVG